MKLLRLLLLPFSILYAIGVIVRNLAYDLGIFRSQQFDLPVISVGNLAVGGSGKSPMTEYLIRLLKDEYKIATLSRGYGRKTKGFLEVSTQSSSSESGDEPLQFKRKFKDITVAVCEDRVLGIKKLKEDHELILLDDAFQHRAVMPGLSILLFEYHSLLTPQFLLPAGNLREPVWESARADLIIVSKCPVSLQFHEKKRLMERINPDKTQKIFFSYLRYGNLRALNSGSTRLLDSITSQTGIVLLTGIANPDPILNELNQYRPDIIHHSYPDHHPFTEKNISKLVQSFHDLDREDKLIITTEKDAQRLDMKALEDLPVYILPVETVFDESEAAIFNEIITRYVSEFSGNN